MDSSGGGDGDGSGDAAGRLESFKVKVKCLLKVKLSVILKNFSAYNQQ